MSEHKSEKIAKQINREGLIKFYYSHLPKDTIAEFNLGSYHILSTVLSILEIPRMSPSEMAKLQQLLMTDEQREIKSKKITNSQLGQKRSLEARHNMSVAQKRVDHTKFSCSGRATRFQKGITPWNKSKRGLQVQSAETMKRRYETMRKRGTFNSSKQEDSYYCILCESYGSENIIRQYKEDRYPFACDFYIITEDLFIELNRCWTHGGMPFDENSAECQEKLALWQEKAKTSNYYKNAIYTWTDLDVRKRKTAEKNNLNYKVLY